MNGMKYGLNFNNKKIQIEGSLRIYDFSFFTGNCVSWACVHHTMTAEVGANNQSVKMTTDHNMIQIRGQENVTGTKAGFMVPREIDSRCCERFIPVQMCVCIVLQHHRRCFSAAVSSCMRQTFAVPGRAETTKLQHSSSKKKTFHASGEHHCRLRCRCKTKSFK